MQICIEQIKAFVKDKRKKEASNEYNTTQKFCKHENMLRPRLVFILYSIQVVSININGTARKNLN